MIALVLAPVLLGVAIYRLPQRVAVCATFAGQFFLAIWGAVLFRESLTGPITSGLGGRQQLLYISLRAEPVALALVLVTVLVTVAVLVSSIREPYLDNKLLLLYGVLQGLAIGILLTDDIFHLFVLIEVATLVCVILTTYRVGPRSVYDALYYLTVQIVGMMFFLFGVAYLYRAFGVLAVSEISKAISAGVPAQVLVLPAAFLLTGLAAKLGLFPLYSFIPRAYGNPGAPVGALALLSGVMTTSYVFWLGRIATLLAPSLDLKLGLTVVGVVTGLFGAAKALLSSNLLVVLAFSTVSQVGLVAFAYASAVPISQTGAAFHLVTHGVAKAALFLGAGLLIRVSGSTQPALIRGVLRDQPVLGAALGVCLLSLAGLPFLAGGASKHWISAGVAGTWREWTFWALSAATMLVVTRLGAMLFGAPAALGHPITQGSGPGTARLPREQVAVVAGLAIVVVCLGLGAGPANFLLGSRASLGLTLALPLRSVMVKGLVTVVLLAAACAGWRTGLWRIETLGPGRDSAMSLPSVCLAMAVLFAAVIGFALVAV